MYIYIYIYIYICVYYVNYSGGMTPRMSLLGSNISPPVFWPEGVKSAYASNPFDKGVYMYLYICIHI
jgi:hypothetical protein